MTECTAVNCRFGRVGLTFCGHCGGTGWEPNTLRHRTAAQPERETLHIVFDGPPGHESGRFIECETPDGRSINAGEWHERSDGFWELRVRTAP